LDKFPTAIAPGHGRLDLGLVAHRDIIGAGARLDWRVSPIVSAFVLGELGYSPVTNDFAGVGMAGMRFDL
jgi:hypothetical protein